MTTPLKIKRTRLSVSIPEQIYEQIGKVVSRSVISKVDAKSNFVLRTHLYRIVRPAGFHGIFRTIRDFAYELARGRKICANVTQEQGEHVSRIRRERKITRSEAVRQIIEEHRRNYKQMEKN